MKLITFGCSWTFGIGANYEKGMSRKQYEDLGSGTWTDEVVSPFAFRTLLSERLGMENVNFSKGGSSNQRQERRALEFFRQDNIEEWKDSVVLWGITSTARDEQYMNHRGEYVNFLYGQENNNTQKDFPFQVTDYAEWFYDNKNQVRRLSFMMSHWNMFFESYGIKNLWFNTFNTYVYPHNISRLVKRDLLTQLTRPQIRDEHTSVWKVDGKRIREAKDKGLVNPYSLHPTKETHILLADILEKNLRAIF